MFPCLQAFSGTLHLSELAEDPQLVKEIQKLLKAANFYTGEIDGILGSRSIDAFVRFKRVSFLEFPNLFGRSTADALLEVASIGKHPIPKDDAIAPQLGKVAYLRLPTDETVILNQMITGSRHFTWAEATKNGTRVPRTKAIVQNIIKTALYLDKVRALFGHRSVTITSWYRPPDVNRAVGGVKNSYHLFGNAVDFVIKDISPLEVYARLHTWHGMNGGLGRNSTFTHLDLRGYFARFNYGK